MFNSTLHVVINKSYPTTSNNFKSLLNHYIIYIYYINKYTSASHLQVKCTVVISICYREEDMEWWHLSSQEIAVHDELAFPEMAKRLPASGKQWTNLLFCFAWVCSLYFTY